MANQNPKKQGQGGGKGSSSREEGIFKAPVFVRNPSSRQVRSGGRAALRVVATGIPRPSFQWFHNGSKIAGATGDALVLANVRALNGGHYHCEAFNFAGRAASSVATVTVVSQSLPALVVDPPELAVAPGQPMTLRIVSAPPEMLRQFKLIWTFNGKRIRGANGHELQIAAAKAKYEGVYKAMATTAAGLMVSNAVKVTVTEAAAPGAEAILAAEPLVQPAEPVAADSCFFNPEEEPTPDFSSDPLTEIPAEQPEDLSADLAVDLPVDLAPQPQSGAPGGTAEAGDAPSEAAIDLSADFPADLSLDGEHALPPQLVEAEPGPISLGAEDAAPAPKPEAPSRKVSLLSRLQEAFRRQQAEKTNPGKPGNVA